MFCEHFDGLKDRLVFQEPEAVNAPGVGLADAQVPELGVEENASGCDDLFDSN